MVLVKKKDGFTRFCVEYRKLNDVTVKYAYLLPLISDLLDALTGSKCFSGMYLNSGFWQVNIDPLDKEKTALSISFGLYQFTSTPFGLSGSPGTFQRHLQNVLRGLQWEGCLLYMDDIIVPWATFEENLQRLKHTLDRLLSAGLKLKPSKCVFFSN